MDTILSDIGEISPSSPGTETTPLENPESTENPLLDTGDFSNNLTNLKIEKEKARYLQRHSSEIVEIQDTLNAASSRMRRILEQEVLGCMQIVSEKISSLLASTMPPMENVAPEIPRGHLDLLKLVQVTDSQIVYRASNVTLMVDNQLVNFGAFDVVIPASMHVTDLRVYAAGNNITPDGRYKFPYLSSDGSPCVGSNQHRLNDAFEKSDIKAILDVMVSFLWFSHHSDATPYKDALSFLAPAKAAGQNIRLRCRRCSKYTDECVCGSLPVQEEVEECECCGETGGDCGCSYCANCNELTHEDEQYLYGDDVYCSSCRDEYLTWCDGCEAFHWASDTSMYDTRKGSLCRDCLISYAEDGKL